MSHKKDDAIELHARNMVNDVLASCPYASLHSKRPSNANTQYA
ncbi:MAG: hypothetical protein ABSA83_11050 [Verrucomicrobiota bacterium]|jgi:hypothetical protein